MKTVYRFVLIIGFAMPLVSAPDVQAGDWELSGGVSMLLYQSVFSYQASTAFETALKGDLAGQWDWQVGARIGIASEQPELFTRCLVEAHVGRWQPYVGIEFGATGRARFQEGGKLLRETRMAMEDDISPVYIAGHTAPLSFNLGKHWRASLMEIHIGTHLRHMGRTTRLQIGIITLGKTF
ncbi:MAG: hypothetical protein EHM72_13665 [Calditrichaeota bacterium]|nr:MAG: hypothetical protein EHM72_13665 [Calditrichota bacterium]